MDLLLHLQPVRKQDNEFNGQINVTAISQERTTLKYCTKTISTSFFFFFKVKVYTRVSSVLLLYFKSFVSITVSDAEQFGKSSAFICHI